jgi:hypothetical protein
VKTKTFRDDNSYGVMIRVKVYTSVLILALFNARMQIHAFNSETQSSCISALSVKVWLE